ncbi:MAG TPA: hypothetical protein VGI53_07395 [Dyella sp.]|jgi:hypothetical protein
MPFDATPVTDDVSFISFDKAARFLLKEVAARMNQHNWCRCEYDNADSQHCLVGWVRVVLSELVIADITKETIADAVVERLFNSLPRSSRISSYTKRWSVEVYNDRHTYPTVRRLLDRAIAPLGK